MSTSAIPVVSTLAALVELSAKLSRQTTLRDIGKVLRSSVKWMLPTEYATLILRGDDDVLVKFPEGTPVELTYHLETVLLTRAALEPQDPRVVASALGEPQLVAMMIVPIEAGVLVLASHDKDAFRYVDRGTCHLLALAVEASVRAVRLLEREQTARQVAERAIAQRNKLISTVTHDLRNPLNVVMTLFELNVEADRVPPEDEQDVRECFDRMRSLIDEMIDLARSEGQGELVLQPIRSDLVTLASRAMRTARGQLAARHTLVFELAVDMLVGDFDEHRIMRVLENLISNAIKYSPQGGEIRFVAERVGDRARIAIKDHGLGIPAAHLPKVFERFSRGTNVGSIAGTGLGLSSAREIVVAHGGTLEVESVEGQGSTFTMELPLIRA
ncbi:MAG: HAMP domain-containing sensor histidine kinase [Kofleriaceae bacterium]